ncbi:hypothetical protein [Nocardia rhamnosiphila]|uniref:Protein phosphatase 2C domain-containing protein n=1 Tax=Nocardia rhamnosiphila TaxID=426716 RepID=A0ABV2WWH1_9NOCA
MIQVETGWIVKDGRDHDENADRVGAGAVRFALADGASDAAYPEIWAELLVWSFLQGRNPLEPNTLARLRWLWHERTRADEPDPPWYVTKKRALGSAAAFVGLTIDTHNRRFTATAVGDSCLLHIREGAVITAGPLEHSAQFTRIPALLSTRSGDKSYLKAHWRIDKPYSPGDTFLLASDALAKYLLRRRERGMPMDLAELSGAGTHFATWVVEARADRELDNDDTTFCLVKL